MPLRFQEGDLVWFAHKEDGFRPGVVATIHDADCLDVFDTVGKGLIVMRPTRQALQKRLEDAQLARHVHDMSTLPELNDATILENLRHGFTRDLIYTNIGPTLVAVNPYKQVHCTLNERAPGILRSVREIYDEMLRNKSSHSCVVTGESGAGKSESTRLFVNHLATLSVRQSSRFLSRDTSDHQYVLQERIVQAAPILESFGNAKTVRNANSSRFGKWIEIEIDFATGQPLSANIRNYLLEKSRIVRLGANERNFHIFYQLLADETLRAKFDLASADPAAYRLLRGRGPAADCDLDDAEGLSQLCIAMETMGMTEDEREYVFRCVAALLRLGQVAVSEDNAENGPCEIPPESAEGLRWVAEAFGLSYEALVEALTMRAIRSGGRDQIFKARAPDQVRACLDAFIKSVYSGLFEWITERINVSLDGIADVIEEKTCANDTFARLIESGTIGILDAFGFEIFQTNSFEQLCINYCNEKMQLHFNRLVFEEEVQLYLNEGILDHQEAEAFSDSSAVGIDDCVKLLEGGQGFGIFALIDDELKVPNGSDLGLLRKMVAKHGPHPKFSQPQAPRQTRLSRNESSRDAGPARAPRDNDLFTINHYAGPVTYSILGFLEKSTDPIAVELQLLCAESSNEFFRSSFPTRDEILELSRGRKAKASLGTQFRDQLAYLSDLIFQESTPHFIRCIKPNDSAAPRRWDGVRVLEQIRYAGLLEASQVRAKGFPVQHMHADFLRRFQRLFLDKPKRCTAFAAPAVSESTSNDADEDDEKTCSANGAAGSTLATQELSEELCRDLVSRGLIESQGFRVGRTRTFFRDAISDKLERAQSVVESEAATLIQAVVRSARCRARLASFRGRLVAVRDSLKSASSAQEVASITAQVADLQQLDAPAAFFEKSLEELAEHAKAAAESRACQAQLEEALRGTDVAHLRACAIQCAEANVGEDLVREARRILDSYETLDAMLTRLRPYTKLKRPSTPQEHAGLEEQLSRAKLLMSEIRAHEQPQNAFTDQLEVPCQLAKAEGVLLDIESFSASLVLTAFLRRVADRARVRRRFRELAKTRLDLETALDNRDERGIESALAEMTRLNCGEHATVPHPLVKEAVAIRADLRITKLAALNQLERLTRKLERRIRHRERQLQAELSVEKSPQPQPAKLRKLAKQQQQQQQQQQPVAQPQHLPLSGLTLGPTQPVGQGLFSKSTKTRRAKKKTRRLPGFRLLRSMPALFHAHYGKKSQVRTSELELLTQAVEKAKSAGATEETHVQVREAHALMLRLEALKVQRRSSIRLFSSHSLISLGSTSTPKTSSSDEVEDEETEAIVASSSKGADNAKREGSQRADSRFGPGQRVDLDPHKPEETPSLRRLARLKALRDEEASMLQVLLGHNDPTLGVRIADSGIVLACPAASASKAVDGCPAAPSSDSPRAKAAQSASTPNAALEDRDNRGPERQGDDEDLVNDDDDAGAQSEPAYGYDRMMAEEACVRIDDHDDLKFDLESPLNARNASDSVTLDQSGPIEELGEEGAEDFGIHILVEDVDSFGGSLSHQRSLAAKMNTQLRRKISVKSLQALLPRKRSMTSKAGEIAHADDVEWGASPVQRPEAPRSPKMKSTKVRAANVQDLLAKAAPPAAKPPRPLSFDPQDGLVLPEIASSAERAILERICREREMRKVIQSRCWEARRGLTGALALHNRGNADLHAAAAIGGGPPADFSFSSMYSSASAALPAMSVVPTDHPSFRSETSDRTIPELARRKRALEQRQLQKKQILQQHLQGMQVAEDGSVASSKSSASSSVSSKHSSSVSRRSTKAYTEHWEAIAYVNKNVASTKNF